MMIFFYKMSTYIPVTIYIFLQTRNCTRNFIRGIRRTFIIGIIHKWFGNRSWIWGKKIGNMYFKKSAGILTLDSFLKYNFIYLLFSQTATRTGQTTSTISAVGDLPIRPQPQVVMHVVNHPTNGQGGTHGRYWKLSPLSFFFHLLDKIPLNI